MSEGTRDSLRYLGDKRRSGRFTRRRIRNNCIEERCCFRSVLCWQIRLAHAVPVRARNTPEFVFALAFAAGGNPSPDKIRGRGVFARESAE